MLAKYIPFFNEVNALPIPMDIQLLDDGTGSDVNSDWQQCQIPQQLPINI